MNGMQITVVLVSLAISGMPATTWAKGDEAAKRKAHGEALAQKHKARTDDAVAKRAAAKEAAAAKRAETKESVAAKRGETADNRQDRQSKRIEHGIAKGYLTPQETATLQAQQNSIAALESSYREDGKLTGQEIKSLQTELNTASRCIWGEKHDTEGNQMATYRLGKNVFAKDSFTAKMADPNLSKAEAKALCKDFRRITELKQQLSGTLSDAERTKLQEEYNDILNMYFEVR